MTPYSIVAARPEHVLALASIERAAARLLEGHAPRSVLSAVTDEREFVVAQSQARLWVALAAATPVGFALVRPLSQRQAHLEEIDVLPWHGRRGAGASLVRTACAWACRRGYDELTLTTFRSVPWNMPFYAGLGFEEVAAENLSPELEAVVRDETARGLDRVRRVVMRYRLITLDHSKSLSGRNDAASTPNRPTRD